MTGAFSTTRVARAAAKVERMMLASIRVLGPAASEPVYDVATDSWSTPAVPVVYEGKARVQPLRANARTQVPGNATKVSTYLFSIPIAYKSLNLYPDLQVSVLTAPLNPTLERYVFHISEVGDSSNPVEVTFYCTVNLEAVER